MKNWVNAFRLQTLPLAFSSIIMGTAIVLKEGVLNSSIFTLSLATATCLQILSNLANDYGDAISGVDNENRIGPKRAIQNGDISKIAMRRAVIVFSILSLFFGLLLLNKSFENQTTKFYIFLLIGVLAIIAAIKYTVGKNAYGYSGKGDFSVFVFFGLVGVMGSTILYSNTYILNSVLPAITIGLFSVGVLNLNNLRDVENDSVHNKNTLIVKYGREWGQKYHYILIIIGWCTYLIFTLIYGNSILELLPIITFPIFLKNLAQVKKYQNPERLNGSLKTLALGTFSFALVYFIAVLFNTYI